MEWNALLQYEQAETDRPRELLPGKRDHMEPAVGLALPHQCPYQRDCFVDDVYEQQKYSALDA